MNNIKVKCGDVYITDFRGLDCGLYGFVPTIIVQNDRATLMVNVINTWSEASETTAKMK